MKNLHLIATNKFSQFIQNNRGILKVNDNFTQSDLDFIQAKFINIYITNDEELNKDTKPCWCLDTKNNSVNYYQGALPLHNYIGYKKIILSTDQDLDGVQSIDDDFLEWFVKNPSCEEVETIIVSTWCNDGKVCVCNVPKFCNEKRNDFKYKIIIPKEEQKELRRKLFTLIKSLEQEEPKQETLEETAERLFSKEKYPTEFKTFRKAFISNAKWQQERMYSEEEMLQALNIGFTSTDETWEECVEFTKEQFKKKYL